MLLRDLAHARCGDKGNRANISVVVYESSAYPRLAKWLTAERVKRHMGDIVLGKVERYELPQLGALNFVLHEALAGGVTGSLRLDAHGKSLSSALLAMELPEDW